METLGLKSVRLILQQIDGGSGGDDVHNIPKDSMNEKLNYIRVLARSKRFYRRRFCVRLNLPRYTFCDYSLTSAIYPLTLREILFYRQELRLGQRITLYVRPLRPSTRVVVHCTLNFRRNLLCQCYACKRLK